MKVGLFFFVLRLLWVSTYSVAEIVVPTENHHENSSSDLEIHGGSEFIPDTGEDKNVSL